MTSIASSSISSRSSGAGQRAPVTCSLRFSPVPTPRKKRPGISVAEVAAAWAITAGWVRISGHVTPVPRRSFSVRAAIAPITPHTNGACPCASIQGWKWSEMDANDIPAASAGPRCRRARAARAPRSRGRNGSPWSAAYRPAAVGKRTTLPGSTCCKADSRPGLSSSTARSVSVGWDVEVTRHGFRVAPRDPRSVGAALAPHRSQVVPVRVDQMLAADVSGGVEEGQPDTDRHLEDASPLPCGRAAKSVEQAGKLGRRGQARRVSTQIRE